MFLLFGIAVGVVILAFHTPELQLVQDMTDEELEETQIKTYQAALFCLLASVMLVAIYLLLDYILDVFTIIVTFQCTVCLGILIQEVLRRLIFKNDSNEIN
jgi:hypothetical protein